MDNKYFDFNIIYKCHRKEETHCHKRCVTCKANKVVTRRGINKKEVMRILGMVLDTYSACPYYLIDSIIIE